MELRSTRATIAILVGVLLLSPFWRQSNYATASSVAVSIPANQTVFGAEMEILTPAQGLDQMVAANATWTRRNGVLWSVVEPTEGVRNWSALTGLESELQDASSKGIQVILLVRSTPQWARKIAGSGSSC